METRTQQNAVIELQSEAEEALAAGVGEGVGSRRMSVGSRPEEPGRWSQQHHPRPRQRILTPISSRSRPIEAADLRHQAALDPHSSAEDLS